MATKYIVWISIERCEGKSDDCDKIESIGEPRQAGSFRTELLAFEHVEYLLDQALARPFGSVK